jgi:hypothetical protein
MEPKYLKFTITNLQWISTTLYHLPFTVTLNNCNYQFMPGAKVIVEQGSAPGVTPVISGGLLTLNGTTFSSVTACNGFWKGVEVWGNPSSNQLVQNGVCAQGRIVMRNSATIKDAEIGVLLASRNANGTINYTEKTGGFIKAENDYANNTYGGRFINNTDGVVILSYHHTIQGLSGERDNLSDLTDCLFEVNAGYLGAAWHNTNLYMYDVKGVSVNGCKFVQTKSTTPSGHGINAYRAGFRVKPLCSVQSAPCQPQYVVKSSFENFAKGINLIWGNPYAMFVDNTIFSGNSRGVSLEHSNYAVVLNSTFSIGKPSALDEQLCEDGTAAAYGIYMTASTGFAIEENNFTKAQGAPLGNYIGIYIAETQATDQVYKNTFTGLSYGNYAVGKNYGVFQENGLAYYCNENSGNWRDFNVVKNDNITPTGGIQDPIGSTQLPAGNTFTDNANSNFYNDGDYWIGYYYYAPTPGNTNTPYYPDAVYRVTREPVVGIQNQCLSHYGGGGGSGSDRELVLTPGEKQQIEMVFATGLSEYNNVRTLYENLKDGGNTNAILSDIETAWPNDMWALRTELLGTSPHLSMEVLKATADKTNVFPESVIFEIMAANPDELKKDALMEYLEEKENPLPEYLIDILKQLAVGSTYKTVLRQQMGHYNQLNTRAAYDILRSILNDSVTDNTDLRNWLDNIGGIRADEQIIASYMSEGNYTDALSLAAMMPLLYNYSGIELTEHDYFMGMLNLQINLEQQEKTMFDLDTIEIANLEFIAENSTGTAGAQAKGILEFAYGYHFCNCITGNTTGYKSSGNVNYAAYNNVFGPEVEVNPNPAGEWTTFNYTLPINNSQGVIKISDVNGKTIETLVVSGTQGQKVWDTRKINNGVYFYTIEMNGLKKSGKIVISK